MPVVRPLRLALLVGAVLLGGFASALAHGPFTGEGQERAAGLATALLLALYWGAYTRGAWLRPVAYRPAIAFHGTAVLCAVVLLGPLDVWAKTSTAAHMAQHMLLMVVIAPLWVLCRPLPQIVAGSGRPGALLCVPMLRLARHPLWAAYLHGALIWFWHLPYFYMLAVAEPWWHALEHACFLVSAGIFWWAVLSASKRNAPWALLALLLTLMHTGFLGAVLTFAHAPLYGEARSLQDQQLAGLIMWVLGGVPYLVASAWIGHRWYGQLLRDRRL
jgi:putative membrane protein